MAMTGLFSSGMAMSKELNLTSQELNRQQTVEFIGLDSNLKMAGVNGSSTPVIVTFDHCENSTNNGSGDDTSDVNTSCTTEPENTDDECSTTMIGNGSHHQGDSEPPAANHQKEGPRRKTFEELLIENKELRRLLDSTDMQISEAKRNHKTSLNANILLTSELRDAQRETSGHKTQLEGDLEKSIRQQEVLQNRVTTMRNGIQELNGMLVELIAQLKNCGNNDEPSMITAPAMNLHTTGQLSITQSVIHNTTSASQTAPSQRSTNIIQQALQRMQMEPRLITTGSTQKASQTFSNGIKRPKKVTEQPRSERRMLEPTPRKISHLASKNEKETKEHSKQVGQVLHAVDTDREQEGCYCICGVSTTTKIGLMSHVKYQTYKRQFRCTVKECGKRYFTTSILRAHMKAQHGLVYKGREGCRKCGQTFLSRMQLYLHCKNIHKCGPLLANKRGRGQESSKCYSPPEPMTTFEPSSENGSCNYYKTGKGYAATPNNKLTRNLRLYEMRHEMDTSKLNHEGYGCVCGRNFPSKHNLQLHIRYFSSHHKFPCPVCGNRYNGSNLLKQHMKIKHNGNGCRTRGLIFQSRTTCNMGHIGSGKPQPQIDTSAITSAPPLKRQRKTPIKYIEESESYLNRPSKLKRGSSSLHAADPNCFDGEIKCLCGTTFTTTHTLLRHIKLRTTTSTFKCSFCPRRFPRRDYVKKHVISTHMSIFDNFGPSKNSAANASSGVTIPEKTPASRVKARNNLSNILPSSVSSSPGHGVAISNHKTKAFKCLCGSEFTREEILREHIRLKLGLTEYKCDFCLDTFWRHDYLKLHLQRVHSVVSSGFKCRICGCGGFSTTNDVKKHRAAHHGQEN